MPAGQLRFKIAAQHLETKSRGSPFAFGYNTFLRRWKSLLAACGLPAVWTPAGLRAGGATFGYRAGMSIDQLRLRGRWTSVAALEHYIQETTAFAVRSQLSDGLQMFVRNRSKSMWNMVLAALAELAQSSASPRVVETANVHPIMKRLLRNRKIKELEELARQSLI